MYERDGTFQLEIASLANAAFAHNPRPEIARILRETADKIEQGRDVIALRDANGNTVGDAILIECEDEEAA